MVNGVVFIFHPFEILVQNNKVRFETAGFHAQQAVEKALKAVLIHLEMPVPMVHDAGILVAKLPGDLSPPKGYDLSELTLFATELRYREGESPITKASIEAVIAVARLVISWADKQLLLANE